MTGSAPLAPAAVSSPCTQCGACCAYSRTWPRFSLESEAELALIPAAMIADDAGHMRCLDDRCVALSGSVGTLTQCSIYEVRPTVCRDCQPGDPECLTARSHYKLPALAE